MPIGSINGRTLPEPDKFASCPHDEKILAYYEGYFDSVYVLLHPFIKPKNNEIERFKPATWPSKHEFIKSCDVVAWQGILDMSIPGVESLADIDVGLRTSILSLRKELADEEASAQLRKLEAESGILLPAEGEMPPYLENRILNAIEKIGHSWLWVGDEFGTERRLCWIGDLIDNDEIPSHGCLFTHDQKLLVTTHWDSHCSFLCSSRDTIEKILEIEPFEGFYCTPKTEVCWGAYEI